MRRLALLISLLGISVLLSINIFSSPIQINSQKEIPFLQENQKVQISGKVVKDSEYPNYHLLVLNNSIKLHFQSANRLNYLNKNISATGRVSIYSNSIRINVLEMKIK